MFRFENGSLRVFRLARTDVLLHWSWAVLAFVEIPTGLMPYSSRVWPVIEYVTIFELVLLHEFGHVLACRQAGGMAERIVLWPLGGLAMVAPPVRPGPFVWTIAAGPLVNLVLFPLTIGLVLLGRFSGLDLWAADAHRYLFAMAALNFSVLVVNLLPIYPLDGGQLLYGLLWWAIGRARGLTIGAALGLLIETGVIVFTVVVGDGWLAALAAFGMVGCLSALQQARGLSVPRTRCHKELACPACGTAPPVGPCWLCEGCSRYCDVFDAHGVCPFCHTSIGGVRCTDCERQHSLQDWTPGLVTQQEAINAKPVDHAAVAPPSKAEEHANAASYYRKAIVLLSQLLTPEEKNFIGVSDLKMLPTKEASTLLERTKPALDQVRLGANQSAVDWELATGNLGVVVDQCGSLTQLGELLRLRARLAFVDDAGQAAFEDLATMLVMARHCGCAGLWLHKVLQFGLELRAGELAAAHLLEQSADTLQWFDAALARLPGAGTLANAIKHERRYAVEVNRPQLDTASLAETHKNLSFLVGPVEASAILEEEGPYPGGYLKIWERGVVVLDELPPILALRGTPLRRALADFERRHTMANGKLKPEVRLMPLGQLAYADERARVRLAMLRAAVNIAREPDWRKAVRDPSRTGRFHCRRFRAGFELKCWTGFANQLPVTLCVLRQ
jgi:Zn-dependent protease